MKLRVLLTLSALMLASLGNSMADETSPAPLKLGMIGLDTSHVPAFASVLHREGNTGPLANVRIVAAYPGGSPDIPASRDRIEGFTATMRDKHNVEIVGSIEALLPKVDAVLIMSVDGRPHLEQARPVLAARKPLFIDKPLAGSLADAVAIFELARKHDVPCFSSSSLRFSPGIQSMRNNDEVGEILGCDAYSPCSLEEHHPDLFWYGVHGVEILFTIMGGGCESVTRVQTDGAEHVTGVWKGGRIGTFRGIRQGKADYGATVFGSKAIAQAGTYAGYEPLVVEICKFIRSGSPPVSPEETIEMFAFMEAADESKRRGGKTITIESVLAKARQELSGRN